VVRSPVVRAVVACALGCAATALRAAQADSRPDRGRGKSCRGWRCSTPVRRTRRPFPADRQLQPARRARGGRDSAHL